MKRALVTVARGAVVVALGLGGLASMSAAHGLGALCPNLILPLCLYLGSARADDIAFGGGLTLLLGGFTDAAAGLPLGLFTSVYVGVFLLARSGRARPLEGAWPAIAALTFGLSIAADIVTLGARALLEPPAPFSDPAATRLAGVVLMHALATGAAAPAIFSLVRRTLNALPTASGRATLDVAEAI